MRNRVLFRELPVIAAEEEHWRRVALVGGVLVVAALLPGSEREQPQPPPFNVDKLAHAAGHGAFAVTLVDAIRASERPAPALTAICISAIGGVALELLQIHVPGRRFEVGDVLSGALGGAVAVVLLRGRRQA